MRPTFFRAVFGIWAICPRFKFVSTYFTNVFNAGSSVFSPYCMGAFSRATNSICGAGMKHFPTNGANFGREFSNIEVMTLQKPSIGFHFSPAATFAEFHTYILDLQMFIDCYVAVCLQRYQDATGKEPARIND
jgi:hypothetical protein